MFLTWPKVTFSDDKPWFYKILFQTLYPLVNKHGKTEQLSLLVSHSHLFPAEIPFLASISPSTLLLLANYPLNSCTAVNTTGPEASSTQITRFSGGLKTCHYYTSTGLLGRKAKPRENGQNAGPPEDKPPLVRARQAARTLLPRASLPGHPGGPGARSPAGPAAADTSAGPPRATAHPRRPGPPGTPHLAPPVLRAEEQGDSTPRAGRTCGPGPARRRPRGERAVPASPAMTLQSAARPPGPLLPSAAGPRAPLPAAP